MKTIAINRLFLNSNLFEKKELIQLLSAIDNAKFDYHKSGAEFEMMTSSENFFELVQTK